MTVLKTSVFIQEDKTRAGCCDEGGDFLAGLLIEELDVGETTGLSQAFYAIFLGTFAEEKKKYVGILVLQLGSCVKQGLKAVRVAHGANVANEKFVIGIQLFPKVDS
jgi:hypothetical protein